MSNSETEFVKLSQDEVKTELEKLNSGWELIKDGTELCKAFKFKGYYKTIAFVNSVAWIAQQEKHHPDLEVGYGQCQVRYTTHDAGGLTANDFKCAQKIESLGV